MMQTLMEPQIIVGGGISGLIAASILAKRGIPYIGLERTERLGGRVESGHHRLHDPDAVSFMARLEESTAWERIVLAPQERKKGEWGGLSAEYSTEEEFYLHNEYFLPKPSLANFAEHLANKVGSNFQLQKVVVNVDSSEKVVQCQDGTSFRYSKLIWCSSLQQLTRVWKGGLLAPTRKSNKNASESTAGINLELELKAPLFELRNTAVFPFRYKSYLLKALGFVDPCSEAGKYRMDWMVFLKKELAEDREETAKCVRALKRELQKEFPELKERIQSERISYFKPMSGEIQIPLESLEVGPDILVLGPEVRTKEGKESLMNLDRALDNCVQFEATLPATEPTSPNPPENAL